MLDQIKSDIQSRLKFALPLGYHIALDFGDEGKLFIHDDNQVDDIAAEADTTLTLTSETMQKILSGDTDPNTAVLMGKMKVGGKIGVAMKLASYLEQ